MLVLVAVTFATIGSMNAWRLGRGCNSGCAVRATSCATSCATTQQVIEEPTPPVCTKVVEVQPKKIVIPQAELVERVPQPAKEVRIPQPPIPQPDLIKYEKVPDLIRTIPQAPIVRWECPCGTTASTSCGC